MHLYTDPRDKGKSVIIVIMLLPYIVNYALLSICCVVPTWMLT